MIETVFSYLDVFEDLLWGCLGAPLILGLGLLLSLQSRCFQIRKFPAVVKWFISCFSIKKHEVKAGIHPLQAFFACVGGCVGIGNIVGICTAVQVGGPGAIFWIWVTAILGAIVKYTEVYLGVKHRVQNERGEHSGGPMYFLQRATSNKWIPMIVALFLCVYGVEVYQFSVITESLSRNFHCNRLLIGIALLGLVFFAGKGGLRRVGAICGAIIPIFVVLYMGMGIWVLIQNASDLPLLFATIFKSAFSPSSAVGGFIGSSVILTLSQGVRRGCYTSDVGVGYASVIHSESAATSPQQQASLVIFDVFLDTFLVCTMSVLLILVTGIWNQPLGADLLVQKALATHFPLVDVFMPIFLLLLGYSTITAYFCVGIKCAEFISKKNGKRLFVLFALTALLLSVFVDTSQAQSIMSISGGVLLIINCWGIFQLRHEADYSMPHYNTMAAQG